MHIALFIPTLTGGGAERVTLNLARGLIENGHNVDLVLVSKTGPLSDDIPDEARLVVLGGSRTSLSVPRLARYLTKVNPDVLISALAHANIFSIIAGQMSRSDTKIVITLHNNYSTSSQVNTSLKWKITTRLARILYPKADSVIAVSRGVANDIQEFLGLNDALVTYVYNPVVTPDKLAHVKSLRTSSSKNSQTAMLLAVGRLAPQKDFANLLKAFRIVLDSGVDAHLKILGEGPLRQELENLVSELNLERFVSMPGFVPNVFQHMVESDLFILSSLYEGLPTVLIEALAAGCNIVSTDCPSGPHELLQGGRFGALVPVSEPDILAKAIVNTLHNPTADRAGMESWVQEFSFTTAATRYVDVIEQLSEANVGEEPTGQSGVETATSHVGSQGFGQRRSA